MINRRTCVAAIGAQVFATGLARAQPKYPERVVKIVAPTAPGAPIDSAARMVARVLGDAWGQSVVVENRTGAGGMIGAAAVAKSAPDGYTLLVHSNSHCSNGVLYKSAPYDIDKDFADVFYLGGGPFVVVTKKGAYADAKSLLAAARKAPGALTFGSAGVGSVTHLAAEQFFEQAQIKATHVPFKGTQEVFNSILAGDTHCYFAPAGSADSLIRNGRLGALAVTTTTRSEQFPDLPTLRELGFPDYESSGWMGVWAPRATPVEVVSKIHADLQRAFQNPAVTAALAAIGFTHASMTREQFSRFVQKQVAVYRGIARSANISLD